MSKRTRVPEYVSVKLSILRLGYGTTANGFEEFRAATQTSNKVENLHGDGSSTIHVGDNIYEFTTARKRRKQHVSSIDARLKRKTIRVPYNPNRKFQGRDKEIERIQELLNKPKIYGARGLRVVAIQGLGGMGKTQLALEYILDNQESYNGIFWLRAEDSTILQQDFAEIAKAVQTTTPTSPDLSSAVQLSRDWLQNTDEPWILVFDNVDSVEEIEGDFWPHWGNGHIILTTRDRDIANRLADDSKIVLNGLDSEKGSSLLLDYVGLYQSESVLSRKIVNELGGLPLALCQMGTFIQQTGSTLNEFYQMLRERKHSIRLYSDEPSTSSLQYSNTLASCCDLSFAQLSQEERHLLTVIAFFQTDEVQETFVIKGCVKAPRLKGYTDMWTWNNAIRMLDKHALVRRIPDKSNRFLWIHRVIKHHALHMLDSGSHSERMKAFEDAVDIAMQMFPSRPLDGGTMSKSWTDCEMWLPHVLSLREAFHSFIPPMNNPPRALAHLVCNCAYYMWERGVRHADTFAADALKICKLVLSEDDPDPLPADIMTIMGALKLVNFSTRKESISFFQQALNVRKRHMAATDHPAHVDELQLANAYNNTGAGLLAVEEYDEALKYFERALKIKLQLGDENTMPYDIGLSYYNICRVQMGKGLLSSAKDNAQKAHSLVEGQNGPDDFRSNQFRFTYAQLVVACGDIVEGLRIHERTLEIRKRVMGPYNNDTGVSYYGISCVYQDLGRLNDALGMIDLAIRTFDNEVPNAGDRAARAFFRKHLILQELGKDIESAESLKLAKLRRVELLEEPNCGNESIVEYDALVSYYNK